MTQPTTNIRRRVIRQWRELLTSALAGVQVEVGWPGEGEQGTSVWITRAVGAKSNQGIGSGVGGRRQFDDKFTVEILVQAFNSDQEAAEDRCDELVAAIEERHSTDPTLGLEYFYGDSQDLDIELEAPIRTPAGVWALATVTASYMARIR